MVYARLWSIENHSHLAAMFSLFSRLSSKSASQPKVPILSSTTSRDWRNLRRVQVGCGPKNAYPDWWNVDLRAFPGIDQQLDVTHEWPFAELDYVYAEHFLSALFIDDAVEWFRKVGLSLRKGGRIRISTPNLRWVYRTHFKIDSPDVRRRIDDTFTLNRAFHGWGYKFLYTPEMLTYILTELGYEDVGLHSYGVSNCADLNNIERHGGYSIVDGDPSVVIIEGMRGDKTIQGSAKFLEDIEESFAKYVKHGH